MCRTVPLLTALALSAGLLSWSLSASGLWPARQALGPAHDRDRPVLELESTKHDFGAVPAGPVLRASFRLANRGSRRLVLVEDSRSCDCVKGGQPSIIIPPGATHDLEARLQTAGLRGGVQMEIHYTTNDARRPRLTLALLADVQRPPDDH